MKDGKALPPGIFARRHWPLSLMAAMAIILVALAAGFALRTLTALYEKASRASAAKSIIDQGAYLARWLAEHPACAGPLDEKEDPAQPPAAGRDFDRAVKWLQKMESGVQSVSISENGVILYQSQIDRGDDKPEAIAGRAADRISIRRQKLVVGTNLLPVVIFTRLQTTPEGKKRKLEVAINKAFLDWQSAAAAAALSKMFYLALLTIAVAFAVCLLAMIGLARREMVWQKRNRLDEHLAFAGAVAGSVLHDFRNPLSAMRLDAQLLQSEAAKDHGGQPPRLRELSGRIVKTIERIDKLLAEFLVLAKPEENKRELFEVNDCARDCVELVKNRFATAGLNLALDLTPAPLMVLGFPAQFKRALLNIITNAEQFSPAAGKVTVQTRAEKTSALIKIADAGPGVAGPDRKKIFQLFYSKRPGGTGLGLALARTAIENCGGEIAVATPPGGKGAAFIIKIPLVSGPAPGVPEGIH